MPSSIEPQQVVPATRETDALAAAPAAEASGDSSAPSAEHTAGRSHLRDLREEQLLTQERDAAFTSQNRRATPVSMMGVAPGQLPTDSHTEVFLIGFYAAAKKRAEARGESLEIEVLRQRLQTIVPARSVEQLEAAYERVAEAKNSLDAASLEQVQQRIAALTQDRDLLQLVIRQMNGEQLNSDEEQILSNEKYDQAKALRSGISRAYFEEPALAEYFGAQLGYQVALVELLRGVKYLSALRSDASFNAQERRFDPNAYRSLQELLSGQGDELVVMPFARQSLLDALVSRTEFERTELIGALRNAATDEEFLKALESVPPSAMRMVAAQCGILTGDATHPKPLMEIIQERFSKYDLNRYLAESLVVNDEDRVAAVRFLMAFQKGGAALTEFLAALPPERRGTVIERALADRERLGVCLEPGMLGLYLRDSTTPQGLLRARLRGDELLTAEALLANDQATFSASQLHAAITRGDGATAALILNSARKGGFFSELQGIYQRIYQTALGQDLSDHRRVLSPEMLVVIGAAARGDDQAVFAAAIKSQLGLGRGATGEKYRIWEILAQVPPEERAKFNADFARFLSVDERQQLGNYVQALGGQGFRDEELTLERFLASKLSAGDMLLPAILLRGETPSAWALLQHGLASSHGVDDKFIEQYVLARLADPAHGAQALAEIKVGFSTLSPARGEGKDYYSWIADQVSSDTAKQFGLVLAEPHLVACADDLAIALQSDRAGAGGVIGWITGTDSKNYEGQRARAEELVRQFEHASEAEKPGLRRKLSLSLEMLKDERETALQIREIGADFAAQAGGAIAGTGVILFTGGLAAPVAIGIAGGVGFGSRAITYAALAGHGPDGAHLREYALAGTFDALSMGVMRGASALTARTATALSIQSTTSRLAYIGKMGVAGAVGGGFYGLTMSAAYQARDGRWSAVKLLEGCGYGALSGGAFSAFAASLPQGIQRRTGISTTTTKETVLEGKTPLVEGKQALNNGITVEQRMVTRQVEGFRGRITPRVDTVQLITRVTPQNIVGGVQSVVLNGEVVPLEQELPAHQPQPSRSRERAPRPTGSTANRPRIAEGETREQPLDNEPPQRKTESKQRAEEGSKVVAFPVLPGPSSESEPLPPTWENTGVPRDPAVAASRAQDKPRRKEEEHLSALPLERATARSQNQPQIESSPRASRDISSQEPQRQRPPRRNEVGSVVPHPVQPATVRAKRRVPSTGSDEEGSESESGAFLMRSEARPPPREGTSLLLSGTGLGVGMLNRDEIFHQLAQQESSTKARTLPNYHALRIGAEDSLSEVAPTAIKGAEPLEQVRSGAGVNVAIADEWASNKARGIAREGVEVMRLGSAKVDAALTFAATTSEQSTLGSNEGGVSTRLGARSEVLPVAIQGVIPEISKTVGVVPPHQIPVYSPVAEPPQNEVRSLVSEVGNSVSAKEQGVLVGALVDTSGVRRADSLTAARPKGREVTFNDRFTIQEAPEVLESGRNSAPAVHARAPEWLLSTQDSDTASAISPHARAHSGAATSSSIESPDGGRTATDHGRAQVTLESDTSKLSPRTRIWREETGGDSAITHDDPLALGDSGERIEGRKTLDPTQTDTSIKVTAGPHEEEVERSSKSEATPHARGQQGRTGGNRNRAPQARSRGRDRLLSGLEPRVMREQSALLQQALLADEVVVYLTRRRAELKGEILKFFQGGAGGLKGLSADGLEILQELQRHLGALEREYGARVTEIQRSLEAGLESAPQRSRPRKAILNARSVRVSDETARRSVEGAIFGREVLPTPGRAKKRRRAQLEGDEALDSDLDHREEESGSDPEPTPK